MTCWHRSVIKQRGNKQCDTLECKSSFIASLRTRRRSWAMGLPPVPQYAFMA